MKLPNHSPPRLFLLEAVGYWAFSFFACFESCSIGVEEVQFIASAVLGLSIEIVTIAVNNRRKAIKIRLQGYKKLGQRMKFNTRSQIVHSAQLLAHILIKFCIELLNTFFFRFGSEKDKRIDLHHLPTVSPNGDASFIDVTKQEITPEVLNFREPWAVSFNI